MCAILPVNTGSTHWTCGGYTTKPSLSTRCGQLVVNVCMQAAVEMTVFLIDSHVTFGLLAELTRQFYSSFWIFENDLCLRERHWGDFPHSQSIHKRCGAGPAVAWKQAFGFPSHHPHTWVLFAALASISILLQHCLEHGKMVESSL